MQSPNSRKRSLPLCWMVLIVLDLGLVVMTMAQDQSTPDGTTREPLVMQIEGPDSIAHNEVRFEAVDIIVDSGDRPLAAWQFEIQSRSPGVEIVGI